MLGKLSGLCDGYSRAMEVEEMTLDGATVFTGHKFQDICSCCEVKHHRSSTHTPHLNLWAEVSAKTIKMFLADGTGFGGRLDTNQYSVSILQYRNNPCKFLIFSPAQILIERILWDWVMVDPEHLQLCTEWVLTANQREIDLAKQHAVGEKLLGQATREYQELALGTQVLE